MMALALLFIIFAAVVGSGMMVGVFAYFLNRFRRLEGGSERGLSAAQLTELAGRLQEDLQGLQTEVSALTDRLDFTEKLLMRGDDQPESDPSA